MENNLRLFVKSRMQLKLNNSSVHLSFDRSELYLRISHESAVGGKKKVVAGRSYCRY